MGLRGLLLYGCAHTPQALKQTFRLGAVALLALGFLPSRAAAQAQACPGTISSSTTLTSDILATADGLNPCIVVNGNGITLNLNGHKINVSALANTGVAIDTGTMSNTTIAGNNAIIITAYSTSAAASTSAITSSGGTNLTITGVTLDNEPAAQVLCNESAADENWGTGITLNGVTGATISGNTISCYQVGISVQGSTIAHHGGGSISGNNMYWNIYSKGASGQANINSAGLVLSNSSGWSVSNNTIKYNGSADTGGTCVSQPPALISCAFGVQIINGSYNNSISNNTAVTYNFGGGIYTGPTTSKNTISGNTALSNGPVSNPIDLWDDAPAHSNHWHHNTCATVGGSVPSNAC